ncbi:MAG: LPXTG cell wall anchor domain-containing protein [Acidimicrobiia bacterium]
MAGKTLGRCSLATGLTVGALLFAAPAHAIVADNDDPPPRTELLYPAVSLVKVTGSDGAEVITTEHIVLTTPAELPRTGSESRNLPATITGLVVAGLVSVMVARSRRGAT